MLTTAQATVLGRSVAAPLGTFEAGDIVPHHSRPRLATSTAGARA